MMQLQIKHRLEALKQQELKGTTEHLKNVYKETYYETANEIYDEETGFSNVASTEDAEIFIDKSFETMNVEAVEEAMKEKWHGKTFSERITKNNDKFSEELQKIFVSEMALGHSADKIAKTLSIKMGIRMSNAKRIARTEANRYLSDATFKCYEAAGVKKYIFLATLDYKTSELCKDLDKKVFEVKERQIGLNCNPMHPNCRSTTALYIHADIPTRVARGTDGKGYEVDGEINYKEWFNGLSQQERDKLKFAQKTHKNKKKDKEEYNRLKKKLGNKAPKSFKEYQRIKYQEREKLAEYRKLAREKESKNKAKQRAKEQKQKEIKQRQEAIIAGKVIEHPSYKEKFKQLGENEKVTDTIYDESKKALKHRNKTLKEDLIFINAETGAVSINNKSKESQTVKMTKEQEAMLKNAKEFSIIGIHNHPLSSPPSDSDLAVCWKRKYKYGLIICNGGTVYKYSINHDIIRENINMKLALVDYNGIYKEYDKTRDASVFFTEENQRILNDRGIYIEKMESEYGRKSNN